MCWLPTYRLHKLKCADKLLTMATRIKRKGDKRNVSCVFSSTLLDSLALALITAPLPGTPQTNSEPRLIKSSAENVFVERKEIFGAENTGDTDDSPVFVFLKMSALPLADCVCVHWRRIGRIYFQPFSFPFKFGAVLDFCCFFLSHCELTVRWRARSYEPLKSWRRPGFHT